MQGNNLMDLPDELLEKIGDFVADEDLYECIRNCIKASPELAKMFPRERVKIRVEDRMEQAINKWAQQDSYWEETLMSTIPEISFLLGLEKGTPEGMEKEKAIMHKLYMRSNVRQRDAPCYFVPGVNGLAPFPNLQKKYLKLFSESALQDLAVRQPELHEKIVQGGGYDPPYEPDWRSRRSRNWNHILSAIFAASQ